MHRIDKALTPVRRIAAALPAYAVPQRPPTSNLEPGYHSMTDRTPDGDAGAEPAIVVSVIIATYKTRDLLSDCLQSICLHPPSEPYEIIVVDDASGDGTSEMVRARFPDVRLLQNEVNRHYAISNNRAFHHARGRYIYLLNSDTIILPAAIDRMVEFLRNHAAAGVVGSRLLNEDGTVQWSVKSLPCLGSALFGTRSVITRMFPNNRFSRRHLLHLDHDSAEPFVAGYVSSASMLLPRRVVEEVGYLDERLSYHVDADYCRRVANCGYLCYYLPTAEVIHLNHKGGTMVTGRRRFRSLMEFHVGSYIYFCKHGRGSPWKAARIGVAALLFARFLTSLAAQVSAEIVGMTSPNSLLVNKSEAISSEGNLSETTNVSPIASQE
jgi:N-acetylglucosaminyl-diphospho-decaprenol L-rhamnosyltransferase